MEPGTVRTSTIFISVGGRTEVYRSLEQVPKALLRQLEESTASRNSGTILIADRRGREEILKALNRKGNLSAGRLLSRRMKPRWPSAGVLRRWGLVVLPVAAGLLAWLLASIRW